MDEPFASLDEITRFRLDNDLLTLWARQRWTVVFVTHSVYESVYLSTRIAVMTARPGRTASEVTIEAPAPRDEAFRTSPLYNEYCRDVSARLAAIHAMTAACSMSVARSSRRLATSRISAGSPAAAWLEIGAGARPRRPGPGELVVGRSADRPTTSCPDRSLVVQTLVTRLGHACTRRCW